MDGRNEFILFIGIFSLVSVKATADTVTLAIIVCDNEEVDYKVLPIQDVACFSNISTSRCEELLSFRRQQKQILTMLKSILITWVHAESNGRRGKQKLKKLDLIMICNNRKRFDEISNEVSKWHSKYTTFLTLKFREIEYPPEFHWMKFKYRPCSSYRAYFPELLKRTDPGLKRVIYLDTDMLVFRDIRQLWNTFNRFTGTTLIGAMHSHWNFIRIKQIVRALNINKSIKLKRKEIIVMNPGVQLVNLANWESSNWVRWMKTIENELRSERYPDKAGISTYLSMHNDQFFRLSPTWNFGTHCLWNFKLPHPGCNVQERGVSMLHGYGGNLVLSTKGNLLMNIFSHFKKADLTAELPVARFVKTLRRRTIRRELRNCAEIKIRSKRNYCRNIRVFAAKLLNYLNDLK